MRAAAIIGIGLTALGAVGSRAAELGVIPRKLIVVDKLAAASKAKAVFVVKDASVTKGTGTDPEQVAVRLDVKYGVGTVAGAFAIPAGTAAGWVVNNASVAKFVNTSAPAGPTQTRVAVVKPGTLLKLVGKGLGDVPLDVLASGAPAGRVFTAYSVTNGAEVNRHCSEFSSCIFTSIAGDTGAKLVCKTGAADGQCLARCQGGDAECPASCGPGNDDDCPSCFVDMGQTVVDTCNGLEWERKNVSDGVPNPFNLQDVDNRYSWAGRCANTVAVLCQPNATAATACSAATGGAPGCSECGVGEGACAVDPIPSGAITTVWDWLTQVNAASFAGHTDWRLGTSAGDIGNPTGDAAEVETLFEPSGGSCGGGSGACSDPALGPVTGSTWSASTYSAFPDFAWTVTFTASDIVDPFGKMGAHAARAVRPNP